MKAGTWFFSLAFFISLLKIPSRVSLMPNMFQLRAILCIVSLRCCGCVEPFGADRNSPDGGTHTVRWPMTACGSSAKEMNWCPVTGFSSGRSFPPARFGCCNSCCNLNEEEKCFGSRLAWRVHKICEAERQPTMTRRCFACTRIRALVCVRTLMRVPQRLCRLCSPNDLSPVCDYNKH